MNSRDVRMDLEPRSYVALFLHLRSCLTNQMEKQTKRNGSGAGDLENLSERMQKKLCNHLSIEQFEQIENLFDSGYAFSELRETYEE